MQWDWPLALANKTNYLLEVMVWQKTKDGRRRRPTKAPKLFVPDFMKGTEQSSEISREAEVHTVDEVRALLEHPRT